jgi:hypothetical protein
VCCRLLIWLSLKGALHSQRGSSHVGHSGSAHPAESKRRHILVDTSAKRNYKAVVHIYISHGR